MKEKLKQIMLSKYGKLKTANLGIPGGPEGAAIADALMGPKHDFKYDQIPPEAQDIVEPPTPTTPVATPPVVTAPTPLPAQNTPVKSNPTLPVAAPTDDMQPNSAYNDAARQKLYADLEAKRKSGSNWAAVAGLGDMARRMGGSQGINAQENLQTQVNLENKTGKEDFETGRKSSREELADYLKAKNDKRDFAFKEKEAGLKHEEIKAAREANALARAQVAAERAARQKEALDLKGHKMIQTHATQLSKDQIPQMLNAYNELSKQFDGNKDVAGIGFLDSMVPGVLLSNQGQANVERLNHLSNVFLKLRSGAAVTDPEYKRFLMESQAGKVPTERAVRQWMKHMGSDMQMAMGLAESGLPPELLSEYKSRPDSVTKEDIYQTQEQRAAAPAAPVAPKPHAQDNEAVMWAKANPNDPRAVKILAANGL